MHELLATVGLSLVNPEWINQYVYYYFGEKTLETMEKLTLSGFSLARYYNYVAVKRLLFGFLQ